jgi:hypothetical protein
MVKKFVPLLVPNYGGMQARMIMINAPWYVAIRF